MNFLSHFTRQFRTISGTVKKNAVFGHFLNNLKKRCDKMLENHSKEFENEIKKIKKEQNEIKNSINWITIGLLVLIFFF
jgi:esterase/lipase